MPRSASDQFLELLQDRPAATRVAVAIDSDRLLMDAGLFGKEKLTDKTGRA
jgi:hypothetical protein